MYISADISAEKRAERKALREVLQKKIKDFPQHHWIIHDGPVTSKEEYTPREKPEFD